MKSFTKLPVILWVFFSLLIYGSVLVSPGVFKYSGVISFGIPIILILNFIFLILSLVFKSKFGFVTLVLLIIGWTFINVGISFNGNSDLDQKGIKVLNYNVKWFTNAKTDNYDEVIDWLGKVDADIMCFQEFYPLKNIALRLSKLDGYHVSYDQNRFNNAIFSKFPIVNEGLLLKESKLNNIRFADLLVDKDTVRVYGIHLQSMGIDPNKIQNSEGIKNEYDDIKSRFLFSSASRTEQIEILIDHAKACTYPIIVAGDFNDVPFSYNYFQFRKLFSNAFEEKGSGIGATFNNKIPYLRIDNQFYSDGFRLKAFKTINHIYYSDHFPLVGIYELSD